MEEVTRKEIEVGGIYGMYMSNLTFTVKEVTDTHVAFTNNSVVTIAEFDEYYFFVEMEKKEDVIVSPAHYTTTKISALDVVNDAVNPSHYNGTEVFDQMVLLYGVEAVKGFCICNAYKYRQRAGKKSESIEEDIKKALWYENKYKEL